jgi:hypothetical protein
VPAHLPEQQLTLLAERYRRYPGWIADPGKKPVVMACVDSITTRKLIWESQQDQAALFIDGRMQAEVMRILAHREGDDPQRYAASSVCRS